MGLVLAFLIGYSVGGKGGRDDLEEIMTAARQIMASDEFRSLVRVLRSHLAAVLNDLGAAVSPDSGVSASQTVLERVQSLVDASARFRATSP